MELVGEETKLRALFYELKVADKGLAPEFSRTWNRAVATPSRSQRGRKLSFAFAVVSLVVAASVLGFWWKNWQQEIQPIESSLIGLISAPTPLARESNERIRVEPQDHVTRRSRRVSARRHTALIKLRTEEMRMAVAVFSWQSPTAILMESPANEVLTALPQLEQSVTELKVFLPQAVKKENQ